MVKFSVIFIFLLIFILVPFSSSANDFSYNRLYSNTQPIDSFNYSINVNHSIFTDSWITSIGTLTSVDATQHNNVGGTLTISEIYLRSFGDGEWLELDQGNWFDDSNGWINWDGNSNEFNQNQLDPFINALGYNHTENLTIFYDNRYLTGQLSLYFYNDSSPTNSSYEVMNTTIPSGEIQDRNSYSSLGDGDNLLVKRLLDEINLTILEKGAYNQHTTIDYISGTKDVSMRSELYILYTNGTEVLIGSSPPSIGLIIGSYQQVIWTGSISDDIIFPEGSHLTMYLYATVSGTGQAPSIDLVVADETASRLDIGINPTDIRITEIDPFAFYKDGTTPMQGNANWGGFGISNVATLDNGGSPIVINDDIDLGAKDLTTTGTGRFERLGLGEDAVSNTGLTSDFTFTPTGFGFFYGLQFLVGLTGSDDSVFVAGIDGSVSLRTYSGTISDVKAVSASLLYLGFGGTNPTIGNVYSFSASDFSTSTTVSTDNAYHYYGGGIAGTNTINAYGLFLGDIKDATNNFAIKTGLGDIEFGDVGDGINATINGDLNVTGNITADIYFGDGSQLTGIPNNQTIQDLSLNQTEADVLYEPKSSAGNMVMKFTGGRFYMKVS